MVGNRYNCLAHINMWVNHCGGGNLYFVWEVDVGVSSQNQYGAIKLWGRMDVAEIDYCAMRELADKTE